MQSLTLYKKHMTMAEFLAQAQDFDGWVSASDEPGIVDVVFWAPDEGLRPLDTPKIESKVAPEANFLGDNTRMGNGT